MRLPLSSCSAGPSSGCRNDSDTVVPFSSFLLFFFFFGMDPLQRVLDEGSVRPRIQMPASGHCWPGAQGLRGLSACRRPCPTHWQGHTTKLFHVPSRDLTRVIARFGDQRGGGGLDRRGVHAWIDWLGAGRLLPCLGRARVVDGGKIVCTECYLFRREVQNTMLTRWCIAAPASSRAPSKSTRHESRI